MLTQKNASSFVSPPSFRRLLLIAFLLHRCLIGMRPDPPSFARVWLARLVADMERRAPLSPTDEVVAKRMEQRVYDLDKEFRGYHYSILELMEEDEDFDGEQAILDDDEDKVSNILDRLYVLLNPAKPSAGLFDDPRPKIDKRLAHVDSGLARVVEEMKKLKPSPDMDRCLAEQLGEQLNGLKLELFDVSRSILALTEDTTVQTEEENRISRGIFDACLFIRKW